MANILLDAANWRDQTSLAMPPAWWTGTTYDYIGNSGTGLYYIGASMEYRGTVNAGDVISFSILSTSADPTEFDVTVDGTQVYSQTLVAGTTYTWSSTAFVGGETVLVNLGAGQFLYSQVAVLTPTDISADFWQDFVGTVEL